MTKTLSALRFGVGLCALQVAFALVCFAQTTSGQAAGGQKPAAAAAREWPSDRIGGIAAEWTRAKNWTKEYIDKMPEDGINFKPVPEVRSFAEQMLHLASANFNYGVRGTGATNPYQGKDLTKVEEYKTKSGLTKIVMESYEFVIGNVSKMEPAKLDERLTARGVNVPRSELLLMGFEHQTHHRGQTTIYLRMKGVTPPPEPF